MTSRLNPYITFAGTAREAMEFYKDVLGGTLNLNTFGDLGGATGPDAEKIMHSQLETDLGFTLMASDTPRDALRAGGERLGEPEWGRLRRAA